MPATDPMVSWPSNVSMVVTPFILQKRTLFYTPSRISATWSFLDKHFHPNSVGKIGNRQS